MAEHSIFSPSSFHRILACPGSFQASQRLPKEPSNVFAERGTLLHDVFTMVWQFYVVGDAAGQEDIFNRMDIIPEDQQYVLSCCDFVKAQLITCSPNTTISLEERISLASWGLPDVWGTADVVIRDLDNNKIYVDDHKFGQGVPVYSEENPQLLTYLAGAVGFPATYDEYSVSIIQPPLDIYSTYTLDKAQLEGFVNMVSMGIRECRREDPPLIPSQHACKFCPAKNNCKARYELATQEAQQVFEIAGRLPDVTVEEKSELARMLGNLEQVKKALFADLHATIMNGTQVPGWKLVAGRSIRKWANSESAMKWMMESKAVTEDDMFESKLISPSKAEKLNRKLKKSDDFKKLIIKPMGKPQLVAESDKRPDYDINTKAEDVFAKQD